MSGGSPVSFQRALELFRAGKTAEAARAARLVVLAHSDLAEGWHLLGVAEGLLEHNDEAEAALAKAADLAPNDGEIRSNWGLILARLDRKLDALACQRRACELQPDRASHWCNLGAMLMREEPPLEAERCFRQALKLTPQHVEAAANLGAVLCKMGRHTEAIPVFRMVLGLRPSLAEAHNNLATALLRQGDPWSAEASARRAIELRPDYPEAHASFAAAAIAQKKDVEAYRAYRRALELKPDYHEIRADLLHEARQVCDWELVERLTPLVSAATEQALAQGLKPAEPPFVSLGSFPDPARNLKVAQAYAREIARDMGRLPPIARAAKPEGDKLTIGYLSGDLRNHAVGQLMARVLELHDRSQFRIHVYSFGIDDRSPLRQRIVAAVDAYIDVRPLDHRAAAQKIADDGVDILIDLAGHSGGQRLAICAFRPAPVQVTFLGFPGSSGADFIDALITDRIVTPPEHKPHFAEALVYLPDSFQPNDDHQPISTQPLTRRQINLPERGFVFCSFNQNFKIEPRLWNVWMELLTSVPDAVLWLHRHNDLACDNLRRAAEARNVDSRRILFADWPPKDLHLRRLGLADLALDTLTYNGHTTTSDALWAGLPVVAIAGPHFASRVSASVLNAIGLPELVARDLDDYKAIALRYARDRRALLQLKLKLADNRPTAPLFDSRRYTRNLERAYKTLWQAHRTGRRQEIYEIALTETPMAPDRAAAEAEANRGNAAQAAGQAERALAHYRRALALDPEFHEVLVNIGAAEQALGQIAAAERSYRLLLQRKPDFPPGLNNLGSNLMTQGRLAEADTCFRRALAQTPEDSNLLTNLAAACLQRGAPAEALPLAERALKTIETAALGAKAMAAALAFRAGVRQRLGQTDPAMLDFGAALAEDSENVEAHLGLAELLRGRGKLGLALAHLGEAQRLRPGDGMIAADLQFRAAQACDWPRFAEAKAVADAAIARAIAEGKRPPAGAFAGIAFDDRPQVNLEIARAASAHVARAMAPYKPNYPARSLPGPEGRLRIGYLSHDFGNHPTLHLMNGLFVAHDRTQIEVFAYATNPGDGSDYRRRAETEADHFRDIGSLDAVAAAKRIAEDGIDILVEMKGFTAGARPEIAALRPAPLQLAWLGFPGSSGAEFIDYIVADRIVAPPEAQADFSEKLCLLPHCYQINDRHQPFAPEPASRAAERLPEGALVLASHNQGFKFEPVMFDLWMSLLKDLPSAVLWLWRANDQLEINLRREARQRGVDPDRLVFAETEPKPKHLRRLTLADLALDPRLCNGHTTTSDALWAGLPVIALRGRHFTSRVAASLLTAIEMPELIAETLEEYRALALHYGRDPEALAALKAKLWSKRLSAPLFDTIRFARDLERAYRAIWRRHAAGQPPALVQIADARA